jgi:di/tricarboxylate transporter
MIMSGVTLLIVVLADALEWMDLMVVSGLGVIFLLLLRTLTVEEAFLAARPRILIMIAASFALGSALQVWGVAARVQFECARSVSASGGWRVLRAACVRAQRHCVLCHWSESAPPAYEAVEPQSAQWCSLEHRVCVCATCAFALQNAGVASWVAQKLVNLTANSGTFVLLLAVNVTTSLVNALISNNACMVLMFPVCVTVSVSASFHQRPRASGPASARCGPRARSP